MINLHTRIEVSTFIRYENMKVNAKYRDRAVLEIKREPQSLQVEEKNKEMMMMILLVWQPIGWISLQTIQYSNAHTKVTK